MMGFLSENSPTARLFKRLCALITVSSRINGLIFDCDGTLADTMPIHLKAWCDTFNRYGYDCLPEFIESVQGMPAVKIVEQFNRQFKAAIDARQFALEKNRRASHNLAKARPIEPVMAVVQRFKGKLPMAVASGGIRKNVDLILDSIGLKNVFETVITSDDPVLPKPNPDIFLEAARRMGVQPEFCQVFEDGEAGLVAARKAGMVATDVRIYL